MGTLGGHAHLYRTSGAKRCLTRDRFSHLEPDGIARNTFADGDHHPFTITQRTDLRYLTDPLLPRAILSLARAGPSPWVPASSEAQGGPLGHVAPRRVSPARHEGIWTSINGAGSGLDSTVASNKTRAVRHAASTHCRSTIAIPSAAAVNIAGCHTSPRQNACFLFTHQHSRPSRTFSNSRNADSVKAASSSPSSGAP